MCFERAGEKSSRLEGRVAGTSAKGSIRVPAIALDEFRIGRIPDDARAVVKVDVEGAETHVLAGAGEFLKARRSAWIIEVHGAEQERRLGDLFHDLGYHLEVRNDRCPENLTYYPRYLYAWPEGEEW